MLTQNRTGKIEPVFEKIGRYYYDDPVTRTNGEFDIVTQDTRGYVFYEVKFKAEPVTRADIETEIEQVRRTGLDCYKYAFISRSGFSCGQRDCGQRDDLELIGLGEIYA